MSRPKLLDLFSCAGGAGMGYNRAGFDVYGVDINPQPNYPFWFHQGDALKVTEELLLGRAVTFTRPETRYAPERRRYLGLSDLTLGHGSPPCQSYSDLAHRNGNADKWPRLIAPTRRLFQRMGIPYVIENVSGAEVDMLDPVTLCGTMFPGLRVLRHRLFETNWDLTVPPHGKHPLVFTHDKRKAHYGQLDQDVSFVQVTGGGNCSIANARDAMGVDWMTKAELNEALPPAYTEYIGRQMLARLSLEAA
jgi:DNA (cytosine-5)-methyltransferase 1